MADIDSRADRTLTGIEISPDRVEAAFSMTMIITGVASTGRRIASLNRSGDYALTRLARRSMRL
jgi:hypothetical protein